MQIGRMAWMLPGIVHARRLRDSVARLPDRLRPIRAALSACIRTGLMLRLAACLLAGFTLAGPAAAQTLRYGMMEDPDALDPTLARTFASRMVFAGCGVTTGVETDLLSVSEPGASASAPAPASFPELLSSLAIPC